MGIFISIFPSPPFLAILQWKIMKDLGCAYDCSQARHDGMVFSGRRNQNCWVVTIATISTLPLPPKTRIVKVCKQWSDGVSHSNAHINPFVPSPFPFHLPKGSHNFSISASYKTPVYNAVSLLSTTQQALNYTTNVKQWMANLNVCTLSLIDLRPQQGEGWKLKGSMGIA